MPDTVQSVLIGAASGLVSAILTHFSTKAKLRLDLSAAYDKALQESRLALYKELWAMFEPLARYARDGPVTYETIANVADTSRAWYFQRGGIYLTERSRGPYFAWKAAMQVVLDNELLSRSPQTELETADLNEIIAKASALRTSLSDDIHTKVLSRL